MISGKSNDENQQRAPNEAFVNAVFKALDPTVYKSLSAHQITELSKAIGASSRSRHFIDFRPTIPYFFGSIYLVFLAGKDRRMSQRVTGEKRRNRLGNFIVGLLFLTLFVLIASGGLFWFAYLIKSAMGIDLFPDKHLPDVILELFG